MPVKKAKWCNIQEVNTWSGTMVPQYHGTLVRSLYTWALLDDLGPLLLAFGTWPFALSRGLWLGLDPWPWSVALGPCWYLHLRSHKQRFGFGSEILPGIGGVKKQ